MSTKRTELEARLKAARALVGALEVELEAFDDLLENNIYDSHEAARDAIEERYRGIASEACEGSYCMGDDTYKQDYQVADAIFTAHMAVEYNRHDKQYYYVDGFRYRHAPKVEAS